MTLDPKRLDVAYTAFAKTYPRSSSRAAVADAITAYLGAAPSGRADIMEVLEAGQSFGFDPATGFLHADDGGAPASCVFYEPKGQAPLEGVKEVRARFPYTKFEVFDGTLAEAKAAAQADFEARIRSALLPASAEPVAWAFELANYINGNGSYTGWDKHLSFTKPCVPEASIRNLRALYASPPASGAVEAGWTVKARAAMQKFVDRVEAGEVRSKRTYAEFKELLAAPTEGR